MEFQKYVQITHRGARKRKERNRKQKEQTEQKVNGRLMP